MAKIRKHKKIAADPQSSDLPEGSRDIQRRRQCEIAMTSWKAAAADDDRLCELTTAEVVQLQLTPTMLRHRQIVEKGCVDGKQAGATWRRWSGGDATGL